MSRAGSPLSKHVEWNWLPVSDWALNETRRSCLVAEVGSHWIGPMLQPAAYSNARSRSTSAWTSARVSAGNSPAM